MASASLCRRRACGLLCRLSTWPVRALPRGSLLGEVLVGVPFLAGDRVIWLRQWGGRSTAGCVGGAGQWIAAAPAVEQRPWAGSNSMPALHKTTQRTAVLRAQRLLPAPQRCISGRAAICRSSDATGPAIPTCLCRVSILMDWLKAQAEMPAMMLQQEGQPVAGAAQARAAPSWAPAVRHGSLDPCRACSEEAPSSKWLCPLTQL